ncbi:MULTISPECIES: amidohydrolase family protein [unclassified Streptomyces]|uniref:amidohydrolase family protein n=1 Tax=unclassified Streptomyces TaxID=2593676 RepID=UPI000362C620|nr:amidohydrolase family protein [Streptomyces sp. BoleA5]MYX32746.1 amidohydrolase family protein [Streptomyces sp. SID8377]
MIIDAHCHQWNLALTRHAWLDDPGAAPLRRTFDRPDHCAAAHGLPLGGAVCVQAEESAAELAWLRRAGTSAGIPTLGVVAAVDLSGPRISRHVAMCGDRTPDRATAIAPVVGVRDARMLDAPGPGPDPAAMALLAERGLTVDLLVPDPGRLAAVVHLVAAYPANRFVLDHLPQVCPPGRSAAAHRAAMGVLAELPNLTVKVSGLRMEDSPGEPLRRLLRIAFEFFGSRRLMYGSDWPVSTAGRALGASVQTLGEHLGDLTDAERDDFWHRTALTAYGL